MKRSNYSSNEGGKRMIARPQQSGPQQRNFSTNLFALNVKPNVTFYKYEVACEMSGKSCKEQFTRKFLEQNFDQEKRFAFDGHKQLFSTFDLPDVAQEIPTRGGSHITLKVRRTNMISSDSKDDELKHAINACVNDCLKTNKLYSNRNKFFLPETATDNTGSGFGGNSRGGRGGFGRGGRGRGRGGRGRGGFRLDAGRANRVARGFVANVRFVSDNPTADSKMALNVNMIHSMFSREGPLINIIADVLGKKANEVSTYDLKDRDLQKIFSSSRFTVNHRQGNKEYAFKGFSDDSFDRIYFNNEQTGETENAAEYLKKTYDYDVKRGELPGVIAKDRGHTVHFPIEVCEIVSQQRPPNRLTQFERIDLIKESAVMPLTRRDRIVKFSQNYLVANQFLKKFGIEVLPRPIDVVGLLVPPPIMRIGNSGNVNVNNGVFALQNKAYFKPMELKDVLIINAHGLRDGDELARILPDCLSEHSIQMPRDSNVKITSFSGANTPNIKDIRYDVHNAVDSFKKEYGTPPQLIVCVKNQKDKFLHPRLKYVTEMELGIPSQVIRCAGYNQRSPNFPQQKMSNIALKVNAKLGGTNFRVDFPPIVTSVPTMIVGLDVVHASAFSRNTTSFGSMVATLDRHCTQHYTKVFEQEGEIMKTEDVTRCFYQALEAWHSVNQGCSLQRVVIYRDGVSYSDFQKITSIELRGFYNACIEFAKDRGIDCFQPMMVAICGVKRHNIRLFPVDDREADASGNINAGSLVSSGIVDKGYPNFYMVNHAGLKGTSCPHHYFILHHDPLPGNLTEKDLLDQIFQLTQKLCYSFQRSTRAVSMVSVVYYAHLAAARYQEIHDDMKNSDDHFLAEVQQNEAFKFRRSIRNRLHYI